MLLSLSLFSCLLLSSCGDGKRVSFTKLGIPTEEVYAEGIIARKYFYPLINSFDCYRAYPTAGADKTPIAAHIAQNILTLPLFADLTPDTVDEICDIILS